MLDEYVSVEGAERDYGVVLTGSLEDLTLAVDEEATAAAPRRSAAAEPMGYRVGVDVGGTFTDLICVTPDGEVVLDKTPTTLDDQSTGRDERARRSSPSASAARSPTSAPSSTSSCTAPPPPTTR